MSIVKTCLCPENCSCYIARLYQTTRSRMRYFRSCFLSLIDCFSSLRWVGPGQERPGQEHPGCLCSFLQGSFVLRIPTNNHIYANRFTYLRAMIDCNIYGKQDSSSNQGTLIKPAWKHKCRTERYFIITK